MVSGHFTKQSFYDGKSSFCDGKSLFYDGKREVHFMKVLFYPWVRSGYYDISHETLLSVIKSNMADEYLTLLRLVRDAILSIFRQLDGVNVSEDQEP